MILINVTTNLKLGKPTNEEKYDIKVPNANMDIIDSNIKRLQDADRNFATNENLQAHTERRNNPHEVTKQQIGLDKVVNRQQIYGIPGTVTTGGIPVFDGNGYTVRDSGFTIGKSVPSHAVFTDTTYGIADDNAPGIIKPSDSIRVSSDGTASVADDSHSHDTQYYGKSEAALLHEKNLQDSKKYTDLKLSEHKAENTVQKQIVASLPTSGINTNTIYLVPKTDASTHDHYNEYINLTGDTNGWEFLGNTYIDLTDYYNKSEANRIFFLNSNISQSNENRSNKVPSSAFLFSIIQQKNSQIQDLQNEISEINSNLSELNNRLLKGKAVTYTPTDIFDRIIFRKIGPVVLVMFGRIIREILNTETSKTMSIGTIPEGYRPSSSYVTMLSVTLSGVPMYFGTSSSGEFSVRITRTIAAGISSYGSCVYLSNP